MGAGRRHCVLDTGLHLLSFAGRLCRSGHCGEPQGTHESGSPGDAAPGGVFDATYPLCGTALPAGRRGKRHWTRQASHLGRTGLRGRILAPDRDFSTHHFPRSLRRQVRGSGRAASTRGDRIDLLGRYVRVFHCVACNGAPTPDFHRLCHRSRGFTSGRHTSHPHVRIDWCNLVYQRVGPDGLSAIANRSWPSPAHRRSRQTGLVVLASESHRRSTCEWDHKMKNQRIRYQLSMTFLRGPVTALRHRDVRPDDTFVASYPRVGSTWLRFLLQETLTGEPSTFPSVNRVLPQIGFHENAYRLPNGGRLIKTHEAFRPEYQRAIYLTRDPRDVLLSEYAFQKALGLTTPGVAADS